MSTRVSPARPARAALLRASPDLAPCRPPPPVLKLISLAGDHVADEVWYRVVQIVTNTEDLQPYASRVCLGYLQAPTAHEKLVKPAAYILGEFGHLIANEPGAAPIDQFHALHSKINFCSASTRALLLSTYVKWCVLARRLLCLAQALAAS